jgi:hypothetical protein
MRLFVFPRAGAAAAFLALLSALPPASTMAAPHAAGLATPVLLATGAPTRARRNVNGIPDTGQFLPDTAVVLRVDEKAFTALDFAWNYYNSYPADRPKPDSLGRVEFLNTLTNKEVLGRTAKKVGYDIGFEGRVQLRDYSQRMASNVLFRRAVIDSVVVTDEDVHRVYNQFKTAVRVHRILFVDRATADRVRRDLIAGRISWSAAVKKYSQAIGDHEDGDIGWVRRPGLTFNVAEQVYATKLGEISQVVVDESGQQVVKIVETRADNPPAFDALEGLIRKQLFAAAVDKRANAIQDLLAQHAKFKPDSANIAWACKFFPDPKKMENKGGRATLTVDETIPEFASEDTSRVLARWKDGSLSLNRFLIEYGEISPISRPLVNTPESMTAQAANIALEPYKEQLAIARGYDKDPSYVYQVETQREKLLVERMYSDSVTSRVRSTPEERKAEFEKHRDRYAQLEARRYATILRFSQASGDSLAGLLRAGASAESVIAADARAGFQSGAVHDLREDDHGPFKKLVYEELKPGAAEVITTDQPGKFAVVQLLTVTPRRELSYKEAEEQVYANAEADEAEAVLHEWLARLKKQHKIAAHPELVMKIRLVDPTI